MEKNKKAVILYMPVLHKGYLDFLNKYKKNDIYILGKDFLKKFSSFERDLRVVSSDKIVRSLKALGFKKTFVLGKENINKFDKKYSYIILPLEDINQDFALNYLKGLKVKFESIFLRWDKIITTKEYEVPAHRVISTNDFDREIMNRAQNTASKSADWWRQISALILKDGKIILEGYNTNLPNHYHLDTFGDPRSNFNAGERFDLVLTIHAEAKIISEASRKGISLEGTSIYVTTFPCPVCARLIVNAGIKKVFYLRGYSLMDAEKIFNYFGVEIILVK